MKYIAALMLIIVTAGCASAQSLLPLHKWQAKLKVVDNSGLPVAGAETWVSFYVTPPPGQSGASDKITGLTDTNGMFTASHTDRTTELGFHVQKTGFYPTFLQYEMGLPIQYDPIKWNPNVTLILKKMGQPIPMYAKWINTHVPILDEPIGFDLMAGDWIAPDGKGKDADILFTAHLAKRAENDFDYKLVVSFPNLGDGIQPFVVPEAEKVSALRSPHTAPEDDYKPEWVKTQSRRPGQPSKYSIDENLNFFFRVRTVLDEKGHVKSALYGKIYGDFMHFRYYLNPTSNSRNVEFDPKQNLMKGAKSFEEVTAP